MAVMQQRAKQLGGVQQPAVAADTTHVICPPNLTAQQAADKLRGWSGPTREVAVGQGASVRLPEGVAFVTPDWVSRSIPKHHLLPEEQFLPPGLAPAPASPAAATQAAAGHDGAGTGGQQQQEQQEQQQPQQREHPTGADAEQHRDAAPAGPEPTSSTATVPFSSQQMWAAGQDAQQQDVLQGPAFCRVERRGSEFVAVQGAKPLYTGGDTGIAWGSYGVWQEPYDEAAARQGCRIIGGMLLESINGFCLPMVAQVNSVCRHTCCCRSPFCLLDALREVKEAVYIEWRGSDEHRIKAIDGALWVLGRLTYPLESACDVEQLGLGPKTTAKLCSILRTGTCHQVLAAQLNSKLQELRLFMSVMGVGEQTAKHWVAQNCYTLEDVRRRQQDLGLTQGQKVGLRHFGDMQHKVPRMEVAQAEAIVQERCFELIERLL
ncbi:hypothetical protein CHLNCDRAFT_138090 [Chlorella variabilis]|uniref:DNA polymerase n=1 Tax=Chlorella variabilis TaxID=554065 RepID=E1Z585_CHLVA|nr:hypothetical protein CHLNCDRAFT_138090 [Chlorella variabilis]EFN59186.1 hypothetical protein CHLNCDRAFT_138090 [Chlorella variabilis]|eukprot:XP_005851288.1 hypothetical protein CHLNCDRAFT_138090 [Chlorella variabilis]